MHLLPLATVSHEVRVGAPLRFGVRDRDGNLLLAKGFLVTSANIRIRLVTRGFFVDRDELGDIAVSPARSFG